MGRPARGVHRQRHAAVGAIERRAALAAEHGRGQPAPVQQHQCLLAAIQASCHGLSQRAAQNDVRAFLRVLAAHVDNRHRRQRPVQNAPLHHDSLVAAGQSVLVRLERRRRRSEDDERAGALSAHDRHVAPVIAGGFLLFVRRVVFLVHHNQAKPLDRREHGRTRPDDDIDLASADALPLIMALAVRQSAVLNRDPRPEPPAKRQRNLRRQRNFRNQHQRRTAGATDVVGETNVQLGLAAPGHPVQQRHAKRCGSRQHGQLVRRPTVARRSAPDRVHPTGSPRSTSLQTDRVPCAPGEWRSTRAQRGVGACEATRRAYRARRPAAPPAHPPAARWRPVALPRHAPCRAPSRQTESRWTRLPVRGPGRSAQPPARVLCADRRPLIVCVIVTRPSRARPRTVLRAATASPSERA